MENEKEIVSELIKGLDTRRLEVYAKALTMALQLDVTKSKEKRVEIMGDMSSKEFKQQMKDSGLSKIELLEVEETINKILDIHVSKIALELKVDVQRMISIEADKTRKLVEDSDTATNKLFEEYKKSSDKRMANLEKSNSFLYKIIIGGIGVSIVLQGWVVFTGG